MTFNLSCEYEWIAHGASIEFLINRANADDRAAANALAEALADLPLAMVHAGADIEQQSGSLVTYLKMIRARQSDVLRALKVTKDYPAGVATTRVMSFQQVETQMPPAAVLLNLCVLCAGQYRP